MPLRTMTFRGKRYIEDGVGGWRPIEDRDIVQSEVELPEPISSQVQEFYKAEPGTGPVTRFVMKNFAKDDESAEKYLRSLGYEVRRYKDPSITDPMPFWVRKGPSDSWRPVDPPGAENPVEFIRDALDLTVDAVQSVLTAKAGAAGFAAGGPIGPLTGAAAAGTVYTASEYSRQSAGQLMGIPQEPDIKQAVIGGAFSAALSALPIPKAPLQMAGGFVPEPPPGIVSRAAGRVGEGAMQLSAKISGTTPELLRERGKIRGFGRLAKPEEAVNRIRALLERYENDTELLPMRVEANDIVKQAMDKKIPVDARPLFSAMNEYTLAAREYEKETSRRIILSTTETGTKLAEAGGTTYKPLASGGRGMVRGFAKGSEAEVRKEAELVRETTKRETAEEMVPRSEAAAKAYARDAQVPVIVSGLATRFRQWVEAAGQDTSAVSPKLMEDMKRALQETAAGKGGYQHSEMSKASVEVIGDLAKRARVQMEATMDASGIKGTVTGKLYSEVMADLDGTVRSIGKLEKGFYRGKTEIDQLRTARGTMRVLHGQMEGMEYLDALADIDRRLGTQLQEEFKRAGVIHLTEPNLAKTAKEAALGMQFSESFGTGGQPNIVPRFTAQGKPIGQNFFSQYGAAGGVAGLGMMTGHPLAAVGGLAFASPRSQLALVKTAQTISAHSPSVIAGTGMAANSLAGRSLLIDAIRQAEAQR